MIVMRCLLLVCLLLTGSAAWAQEMQPELLGPPPIDGMSCDRAEGTVFHIHQHLSIYNHGKPLELPAGIGIRMDYRCIYWLHTHNTDGIIHVEAPTFHDFVLGNFFDVWGQPLGPSTVANIHVRKGELRVYVQGRVYKGNPRAIPLVLHSDIVLEAGPPYFMPKQFTDWKGN